MSDQKTQPINAANITLASVQLINGSIESTPDVDISSVDNYTIDFGANIGSSIENNMVRILFDVKFTGCDKNEKPVNAAGKYEVDYVFRIEDLAKHVDIAQEGKKIILHPDLSVMLISIVYSTTRGIILTRTQGTILEGLILPVADPNELIKRQLVAENADLG